MSIFTEREDAVVASLFKQTADCMKENQQLRAELTKIKSRNGELVEALAFYARGNNWNTVDSNAYDQIDKCDVSIEHDWERVYSGGKLARKVLAKEAGAGSES